MIQLSNDSHCLLEKTVQFSRYTDLGSRADVSKITAKVDLVLDRPGTMIISSPSYQLNNDTRIEGAKSGRDRSLARTIHNTKLPHSIRVHASKVLLRGSFLHFL